MPILDSDSLLAVDYFENRRVLRATFRANGRTYDYQNVPSEVYADPLPAPSRGAWFNEHVRDCCRFEPVRGPVRIL